MSRFLVFSVYAPTASWGDIAVGETRGSWERPSRSAILGMVAAGLGVDRRDQATLDRITRGYGTAVRLLLAGHAIPDYHTAQTIPESVIRQYRSGPRRGMVRLLDGINTRTILSSRAVRYDSLATCVVWEEDDPPQSLEQIAEALRRPAFVLFAGRKSNALGLPLAATVVEADTLSEVFGKPTIAEQVLPVGRMARNQHIASEVAFDPSDRIVHGFDKMTRRVQRRDVSVNRIRWQFVERGVDMALMPATKKASS